MYTATSVDFLLLITFQVDKKLPVNKCLSLTCKHLIFVPLPYLIGLTFFNAIT